MPELMNVKLSKLHESPSNPRKTFVGIEKLAESIKAVGLLVPLLVRPFPKRVGEFEVIAGHRRLRAAKKAEIEEVRVEVTDASDAQVMEIQIAENLQRADLTHLEEAETFDAMIKGHGYTPETVAARVAIPLGTVYQRLKLLALCSEGRAALADGVLPPSAAVPLARLPTHALQAKALRQLKDRWQGEPIPARDAIEFVQRGFCRALRGAPFDVKDSMLIEGAGACAKCPKNSATATPGLFDDLTGEHKGQAFCTDTICFEKKSVATWEVQAALAQGEGAKVLSIDEGSKLFIGGNLTYGRFVELDTPNHADKKRTFRDAYDSLPHDARPQRIVAPDRDLRARQLIDLEELTKALRAQPKPPKWVEAEVERKTAARVEAKEAKAERDAQEFTRRLRLEALRRIGNSARSLSDLALQFILQGLADRYIPQDVLEAVGVDRVGFEKLIEKGEGKDLRTALLLWAAVGGDFVTGEGEAPASWKKLIKDNEIDLKALEKQLRQTDEAEAVLAGKKAKS